MRSGVAAEVKRWSAGRKKEVVLRLLRNEPEDDLSHAQLASTGANQSLNYNTLSMTGGLGAGSFRQIVAATNQNVSGGNMTLTGGGTPLAPGRNHARNQIEAAARCKGHDKAYGLGRVGVNLRVHAGRRKNQ